MLKESLEYTGKQKWALTKNLVNLRRVTLHSPFTSDLGFKFNSLVIKYRYPYRFHDNKQFINLLAKFIDYHQTTYRIYLKLKKGRTFYTLFEDDTIQITDREHFLEVENEYFKKDNAKGKVKYMVKKKTAQFKIC